MGSLWNRSGMVERYADVLRAAGAKAYFYNGGTTTPLSVFQDSGEAAAHPFPVVADANGRWPDVFVPYITSYDVRVTSAFGVQLTYTLQVPNPNPVEVTITADPGGLVQTGMVHIELVNTTKAGYVRLNGRTIGNAASAATERANADTSALFTYLWNNLTDTIAPVGGSRGGSAAADYVANKSITLPSMQGALAIGLDDMGNTAAGAFAALIFSAGNATTAGSLIGANSYTLVEAQLPAHTHTAIASSEIVTGTNAASTHTHSGTTDAGTAHQHNVFIRDPGHVHSIAGAATFGSNSAGGSGGNASTAVIINQTGNPQGTLQTTGIHVNSVSGGGSGTDDKTATESAHTHTFSIAASGSHTHVFTADTHTHIITMGAAGSSSTISNLPISRLVTWFIKL